MLDSGPNARRSWQLQGTARQVATVVAVVLVGVAVLLAIIDRLSAASWDSPLLQAWTLVPQLISFLGLLFIGRIRRSVAFGVLGVLVGLIFIEEAFHILNPLATWLGEIAFQASRWTDIRSDVLSGTLTYGFVALVGVAFLGLSHWQGSAGERRVVRNFALLLVAGGFFGGPISTLATMEEPRLWMFVEELGEAIVYAVIAGYVGGLVHAASRTRRPSDRDRLVGSIPDAWRDRRSAGTGQRHHERAL
jgi:hypothetical protein